LEDDGWKWKNMGDWASAGLIIILLCSYPHITYGHICQ